MQAALNICGAAVTLAYPAAVYYGLTRLGTRAVVWCSLPLLVAAALMRMPRDRRARWPCCSRSPPS